MGIGMILMWAPVILLIAWLVQALFGGSAPLRTKEPLQPREIVARRYARGEISQAEFERILQDLE